MKMKVYDRNITPLSGTKSSRLCLVTTLVRVPVNLTLVNKTDLVFVLRRAAHMPTNKPECPIAAASVTVLVHAALQLCMFWVLLSTYNADRRRVLDLVQHSDVLKQ